MLSRSVPSARLSLVRSAIKSCRTFSTAEVAGIPVAVREDQRPISKVSVIVKAGSRYSPAPGVAHVLSKFAFQNTAKRSALRLVRESELLGGSFTSTIDRESIVLTATCLREDLPYFVDALADTTQNSLFKKYELVENVAPLALLESKATYGSSLYTSEAAAYEVAFRSGLGNSVLAEPYSPVSIDQVAAYAKEAYTKANVSIAATNVNGSDFESFVAESFSSLPQGSAISSPASKIFSGEARVKSAGPTALTLVFPFTSTSATSAVLANLLGGASNIKWNTGSTVLGLVANKTGTTIKTSYNTFSDASAITVSISGAETAAIAEAASLVASEIKGLSSSLTEESVKKAVAATKFAQAELAEGSLPVAALDAASVSTSAVADAAAALAKGPVALGAAGKVTSLPYLDELF